jgi:ubiquitin-protein ligase
MVFTKIPYHPNVYIDGKVCISILHAGTDETGYESQSLRWSPVQNITSILMSVLSLLSDPNPDSAANLEASQLYRKDKGAFKAKVQGMA